MSFTILVQSKKASGSSFIIKCHKSGQFMAEISTHDLRTQKYVLFNKLCKLKPGQP